MTNKYYYSTYWLHLNSGTGCFRKIGDWIEKESFSSEYWYKSVAVW